VSVPEQAARYAVAPVSEANISVRPSASPGAASALPADRRGLAYGVLVYALWGIIPVFWKQLEDVPPLEVLAHRAVWGIVVLVLLVRATGSGAAMREAARDRRVLAAMALSGVLVAINWGTFVGAVATGHLLDASLGYFINPLTSVALGTLVLRERLRPLQWLAIGLATVGVALIAWRAGQVPWISLLLAGSWGLYGLVRKVAKVESLVGSTIETALLAPIAAAYLLYLAATGDGALGRAPGSTEALLAATGIVTAGPLLLFTSAARRLPLSTLGFLQYLAPTGQFLLAVAAFGEPLEQGKLAAFGLIWLGLAVFSIDLWRTARRP
jgi:chloramphenicol-sensitive protein RarD